jgi:hypothetical protein
LDKITARRIFTHQRLSSTSCLRPSGFLPPLVGSSQTADEIVPCW